MHELPYWNESAFITLTYDEEHEPVDRSISKRELQLFIKRIRKDLTTPPAGSVEGGPGAAAPESHARKIKYFACGEYGEKTERPHYHLIVFGLNDVTLVRQNWPFGFVMLGGVTFDSARYVTGYIQKKITGKAASNEYQNRQPPFQLQSAGIGRRWAEENHEYLGRNETVTIKGKQYPVPRYYRKVLDLDYQERLQEHFEEHEYAVRDFFAERAITPYERSDYRRSQAKQRELTLIAQNKMKEKKL